MINSIPCTSYESNKLKKKSKFKIWICSIKKNGLAILFCVFTIFLVVFSKSNLIAAKDGLILWATAVVPSLFPFFVATQMLSHTNIVWYLGKIFTPIMRPLFGIPGEGAFAFVMGLISGYPVGAKIVSEFMHDKICSKEEAERMLAFTNNSGPLFIIGTVGITLFGNYNIGILLFITHVLACISVGVIFNICSHSKNNIKQTTTQINYSKKDKISNPTISSLGEILGDSIKSATSTILMIGGFVVTFSVIISILNESNILNSTAYVLFSITSRLGIPFEAIKPILSGIVELTNGVSLITSTNLSNISINIIISAFLLGFGGFSVLLQVFSIISKEKLSIKKYAIREIYSRRSCCFLYFNCLAIYFILAFILLDRFSLVILFYISKEYFYFSRILFIKYFS